MTGRRRGYPAGWRWGKVGVKNGGLGGVKMQVLALVSYTLAAARRGGWLTPVCLDFAGTFNLGGNFTARNKHPRRG